MALKNSYRADFKNLIYKAKINFPCYLFSLSAFILIFKCSSTIITGEKVLKKEGKSKIVTIWQVIGSL